MNRRTMVAVVALATLAAALAGVATVSATPHSLVPTNGALVPSNAQVLSWQDNQVADIDHWYMEISTSPLVDYYPWGFFSGNLVFTTSQRTSAPAPVDLNHLARALAPGTYYWHVGGYYGPFGSLGTSWSSVQSFTVYGATATAPKIAANPSSLTFWVEAGDTSWHQQNLAISNTGGGTLYFTIPAGTAMWLSWAAGTNTGYVYTMPVGVNAQNGGSPLSPGTYTANITILDNGSSPSAASNSPLLVPVTLRVFSSDDAAPTGAKVKIGAGRAATNKTKVTLTLTAADAGSGVGEMRFNNEGGGWSAWVPYATSRAGWVLPAGDGIKTVQAQFRDKVGNQSGVVSDTIVLDTVKPKTKAPEAESVRPGRTAALKYKVVDPAPNGGTAKVVIKVKTLGGKTVKTLTLGAKPVNVTKTASFTCTLARKSYKYFVYATDAAGNAQAVVGSNRLTVR